MFADRRLAACRYHYIAFSILLMSGWSTNAQSAQCEFNVKNEWNAGFTSSISITNDGNQEIDGWQVQLEYPDNTSINNAWNSDVSGDNPYLFSNKNYNSRIQPGSSVSFGFNSQKANSGQAVPVPTLSGICDVDLVLAPTANISVSSQSGELPLTITFDGSSSTSENSEISQFSWNFGDGNVGTGQSIEHTFNDAGEFNVQLVVTNANGDSSPAAINISVAQPQPDDALCEFTVQNEWDSGFTGRVRITNEAPYNIDNWTILLTFPDSTNISGSWNSQLNGSNPYTISNANYNSRIKPGESVQFGFNAQKAQAGSTVSVPELGGMCRADTDSDDPTDDPGDDPDNNPNTAPEAIALASQLTGDAPLTVSFVGTESSDPDGDDISYLWSFAGAGQSTQANPEFTFIEPGTYNVQLTVTDGELENQSDIISITVEQPVIAEPQSYELDISKSSLWFVSSKKLHILENHTFEGLSGEISSDGEASLIIGLDSVNTSIAIRNERMREHLFETDTFPEAQVMLSVDMTSLQSLASGTSQVMDVSALLNLHGVSVPLQTQLRISKLFNGAILVNNLTPVLLSAPDFNLDSGIEMLKSLAGLDAISYTVPVNFHLLFEPKQDMSQQARLSTRDASTRDVSTRDASTRDASTKDVSSEALSTGTVSNEAVSNEAVSNEAVSTPEKAASAGATK